MKKKLFSIIISLVFICTLSPVPCTLAEVPHLINYQGRLTDTGGVPLNGSYNLTFRIYDAETAGNLLWEETQTGVVINKGIFAVLLGSVTNLNIAFDKPYFLEIKVGNELMTPRQRMASGGYALRAEHGVPKGVIVMWSGAIANIPSGWALCDGTNGTPDLRDRFVVGARQDEIDVAKTNLTGSLTQSGGSTFISIANLPAHTHAHALTAAAHTHTVVDSSGNTIWGHGGDTPIHYTWDGVYSPSTSGQVKVTTGSAGGGAISGTIASAGSGAAYAQPYYTLAFIMKLE